jgi:hypothetical protein
MAMAGNRNLIRIEPVFFGEQPVNLAQTNPIGSWYCMPTGCACNPDTSSNDHEPDLRSSPL